MGAYDRYFGHEPLDPTGEYKDESPYELVKRIRQHGDILRTYSLNGWYVINHEDVQGLLRDERLSSQLADNKFVSSAMHWMVGDLPVPFLDHPSMLLLDAPDHTRLRRLTARSFTNRYVQSLEPVIRQLVDELLDAAPLNELDIVEHLARPLPAIIIAEMLGVPREERHLFEEWSAELIHIAELGDPEMIKRAVTAEIAMRAYLAELVEKKRQQRGQDLISSLIEAEEDGDRLTTEELFSTCVLLLTAGHETTTRLIASCLYLLLQHPDQMTEVRGNLDLLEGAIEESLRFEPPIMLVSRTAKETFDYKGVTFKKGQLIVCSIAGANRDPAVFENPDDFDIHRDAKGHNSFGHGIHLCLGMPLARLETRIAMQQLLTRFSDIKLVGTPQWQKNPFFRGLEVMRITATQ